MRYTMLFYLFAVLLLACCGSSANSTSMAQTGEVSDKALYNIFPTSDTDHGITGSFIMDLMKTNDLMPWTDVQNNLVSWTVEADTTQVTQLINHPGIKQVTKLDIPAPPEKRQHKPDDQVQDWMVVPKDAKNGAELQKTFAFLQSVSDTEPIEYTKWDGSLMFWAASMNKARLDQVIQHPGVDHVEFDGDVDLDSVASPPVGRSPSNERRDLEYTTQKDAVTELVSISQPATVRDIGMLKNYVYEKHGGSGSFIYHVEFGGSFSALPAEFPNLAPEQLLTPEARKKTTAPGMPDNYPHGTCTADKALGQQYGVAKNAILVDVVMAFTKVREMVAAFEEIVKDLKAHPERRKHSVAVMSLSGGNSPAGPDNPRRASLQAAIKEVMDMDVPVVVSGGNYADKGRPNIDTIPAVFAAPDYPLIVVGSANAAGDPSKFSQTGPELTIYAVGEGITCFHKDPSEPKTNLKGTSYAAPLVAGHIANLLAYDTLPIDTSDGNLVKSMRDYIAFNPDNGWNRKPDTRLLWNGVDEGYNPPETPDVNTNNYVKTCAGLASNKYVSRETLRAAIVNDFCPASNKYGLISMRFKKDTMDDVLISGTIPWSHINYRPTIDNCERWMLAEITDGCDGNNPTGNPANYKGGGDLVLFPNITFRIEPQTVRQPAVKGVQGSCDSTYKLLFNEYVMWGHGWASDDFGEGLKGQIAACALLPDTWDFQYGLGSDGREWTAKFRTGVFQRRCVTAAAKESGANENFGCNGSG